MGEAAACAATAVSGSSGEETFGDKGAATGVKVRGTAAACTLAEGEGEVEGGTAAALALAEVEEGEVGGVGTSRVEGLESAAPSIARANEALGDRGDGDFDRALSGCLLGVEGMAV